MLALVVAVICVCPPAVLCSECVDKACKVAFDRSFPEVSAEAMLREYLGREPDVLQPLVIEGGSEEINEACSKLHGAGCVVAGARERGSSDSTESDDGDGASKPIFRGGLKNPLPKGRRLIFTGDAKLILKHYRQPHPFGEVVVVPAMLEGGARRTELRAAVDLLLEKAPTDNKFVIDWGKLQRFADSVKDLPSKRTKACEGGPNEAVSVLRAVGAMTGVVTMSELDGAVRAAAELVRKDHGGLDGVQFQGINDDGKSNGWVFSMLKAHETLKQEALAGAEDKSETGQYAYVDDNTCSGTQAWNSAADWLDARADNAHKHGGSRNAPPAVLSVVALFGTDAARQYWSLESLMKAVKGRGSNVPYGSVTCTFVEETPSVLKATLTWKGEGKTAVELPFTIRKHIVHRIPSLAELLAPDVTGSAGRCLANVLDTESLATKINAYFDWKTVDDLSMVPKLRNGLLTDPEENPKKLGVGHRYLPGICPCYKITYGNLEHCARDSFLDSFQKGVAGPGTVEGYRACACDQQTYLKGARSFQVPAFRHTQGGRSSAHFVSDGKVNPEVCSLALKETATLNAILESILESQQLPEFNLGCKKPVAPTKPARDTWGDSGDSNRGLLQDGSTDSDASDTDWGAGGVDPDASWGDGTPSGSGQALNVSESLNDSSSASLGSDPPSC